RQRGAGVNRRNASTRINRAVLAGHALSGCACGVEQAGGVDAEELERVNARTRTARGERSGNLAGRCNSVGDYGAAVDVCVLVSPGIAGVDQVHELRREDVPLFDADEMITRAVEFRPIRNI